MRPAHVYEYLRRADGQRRPAQGSLLRVAFWGWRRREGWKKEKKEKENDECSMVQRSLGEKRKKRGHRNCLRWIAFVSEFFFFLLTLDEEQNFACN